MSTFKVRRLERCLVEYEVEAPDKLGAMAVVQTKPEAQIGPVIRFLMELGRQEDEFRETSLVQIEEFEGGGSGERHATKCQCGADLCKPGSVELTSLVDGRYTFHLTRLDGLGRVVDVDDVLKRRTSGGVGCSLCRCPIGLTTTESLEEKGD